MVTTGTPVTTSAPTWSRSVWLTKPSAGARTSVRREVEQGLLALATRAACDAGCWPAGAGRSARRALAPPRRWALASRSRASWTCVPRRRRSAARVVKPRLQQRLVAVELALGEAEIGLGALDVGAGVRRTRSSAR